MSAPQTEKKKSSCLALGGAGCLIVLILVVAAAGIAWMKFGPQIQQKIEEFQKDPDRTAAVTLLELNPDIEVIKIDDEKRIVTFKVKSSGETITATFTAIAKSRMTYINGKTEMHDLERYSPEAAAEAPSSPSEPAPKAP